MYYSSVFLSDDFKPFDDVSFSKTLSSNSDALKEPLTKAICRFELSRVSIGWWSAWGGGVYIQYANENKVTLIILADIAIRK